MSCIYGPMIDTYAHRHSQQYAPVMPKCMTEKSLRHLRLSENAITRHILQLQCIIAAFLVLWHSPLMKTPGKSYSRRKSMHLTLQLTLEIRKTLRSCVIISKIKVLHLKIKVYMKKCSIVHPLRKSIKSKRALRMGQSCSRHARNPLTQQLPATYHRGWSGVKIPWPCSVMIKREEMVL